MHSARWASSARNGSGDSFTERLRDLWKKARTARERRIQQMQLLETLPLGGKRQLMLIQCGAERFLVGGGFDRVETIVKVGGHWDATGDSQDELCD